MTDALLEDVLTARRRRTPSALVTVAATRGSVPRAAGSKMLVYEDGANQGSVGGGKFESLVIDEAKQQVRSKQPLLKTYPLHEVSPESFGAICGGEVTVLIEPQTRTKQFFGRRRPLCTGHCQSGGRLWIVCHSGRRPRRSDRAIASPSHANQRY